jgi:hypothetical protein
VAKTYDQIEKPTIFMTRTIFAVFCLMAVSAVLCSCGASCDYVNVPYVAVEEIQVPLTYSVGNSTWRRIDGTVIFDLHPRLHTETEITNTSEKGGSFRLVKKYETTQDEEIVFEDEKYINAGQTRTFVFEKELPDYITIKESKTQYEVYPSVMKVKTETTKFRPCNTCDTDCKALTNQYYRGAVPAQTDSSTWVFYDNSLMAKFKRLTEKL